MTLDRALGYARVFMFTAFGLMMTVLALNLMWLNTRTDVELRFLNKEVLSVVQNANQTLNEAHKLIFTANISAAETGKAAMQENRMLFVLNPKLIAAMDNLNGMALESQKTLEGLRLNSNQVSVATVRTLNSFNSVGDSLNTTAVQANNTLTDFDKVVNNADIGRTLASTAATMQELHGTAVETHQAAVNLNSMSADTRSSEHRMLHPSCWFRHCK